MEGLFHEPTASSGLRQAYRLNKENLPIRGARRFGELPPMAMILENGVFDADIWSKRLARVLASMVPQISDRPVVANFPL